MFTEVYFLAVKLMTNKTQNFLDSWRMCRNDTFCNIIWINGKFLTGHADKIIMEWPIIKKKELSNYFY